MEDNMTIWTYVPVPVKLKTGQYTYGDLPLGSFNNITKKWEPVENSRGLAYASRNQMRYRK